MKKISVTELKQGDAVVPVPNLDISDRLGMWHIVRPGLVFVDAIDLPFVLVHDGGMDDYADLELLNSDAVVFWRPSAETVTALQTAWKREQEARAARRASRQRRNP